MRQFEIHPAAELFPMMDEEEFNTLVQSIEKIGLLHPVLLFEDKILDGRNRVRACHHLGIEPAYKTAHFVRDPYEWVWSTNAERRHLPKGQLAIIKAKQIAASEEWRRAREEEERERRSEGMKGKRNRAKEKGVPSCGGSPVAPAKKRGGTSKGSTAAVAAKEAGVSTRTMERAIALQKADPEAADKVASGEMTMTAATREPHEIEIKTTSIKLPGDLFTRVEAYAQKKGLTRTAAIVELLERAIAAMELAA